MALIFDCETDGLLDKISKVHCIVVKDTESGRIQTFTPGRIEEALCLLEAEPLIAGHNVLKYDVPALKKVYPWFKPKGQIRDTLTMTRLIWSDLKERDFEKVKTTPDFPKNLIGSHSLKAWGYRLGCLKGEFGEQTDWSTYSPEMLAYCLQDVEVTHKLWDRIQAEKYSERAIQLEHDFQEVLWLQEQHGFGFDKKAAVELYSRLGQRRAELEKELAGMAPGWDIPMKVPAYWVANGVQYATKGDATKAKAKGATPGPVKTKHIAFNPSSRDHIARLLIERHGWKPRDFTGEGKPTVDESVLEALPFPEAKLLNEYFLVEKRIGMLAEGNNAWLRLERNGRIHGSVNTNGAVTGRCTHSQPNMAQVPGVGAPYGKECRSLFIPRPGYVLVGCDASGLELRCLAHYMAKYDGGAYAKELLTGDIHTANQRAAGLETRNQAKTFIYAYLYGAGDEKIGSIVGKGSAAGKALKASFLAKTPALKRLREDVSAASKRGYLIGLDGRRIPVRSEHSALNTLLQSAGALIMKGATVALFNDLTATGWEFGKDWALVAHVHDEYQLEVRPELSEDCGKRACAAMARSGEDFGFRCPIAGEYRVGASWAGTH